MELALNLGFRTVEELETTMSIEEFALWQRFNSYNLLPIRRMEYYLAQIASMITYVNHSLGGGKPHGLKDFLLDQQFKESQKEDTAETGAEAIGAVVGGIKIVHIGKKRKRNGGVAR